MLVDVATGGSLTIPAATDYAMQSKMFAGYLQNDWKVTRKVTLTLGLHYELETAITERFNRDHAQQLGSNIRTLSRWFNGIRADAYNFWDASLLKNTKIAAAIPVLIPW